MRKYLNPIFVFYRIKKEIRYPTTRLGIAIIGNYIQLKNIFKKKIKNDCMYAMYDLTISPNTYNFCEFIVLCNDEIIKRKLKKFKVIFIPRINENEITKNKEYFSVINEDIYQWRFLNILIPLTYCSKFCIGYDIAENDNQIKRYLSYKNIHPINFSFKNRIRLDTNIIYMKYSSLKKIGLSAPKSSLIYLEKILDAKKIKNYITITIRHQEYDSIRNSNLESWNKFTDYLSKYKNLSVVVIPDTDNITVTENLFKNSHKAIEASHNILLRFAYYQKSTFNFFAGGGPSSLCYLNNEIKYIMFKYGHVKGSIIHTKKAFKNFEPNTNFRFSSKNQILIWKTDSYDNLIKYFNKYVLEEIKTKI